MTSTNASVMPRTIDCQICTASGKLDFITFQCNHKCCKDCYSKISKCHLCRYEFKKCKVMKTTVTLAAFESIHIPFHFDAISREVDEALFERNCAIMLLVLTINNIDVTKCKLNDFTIDNDNIEVDDGLMNKIADSMGIIRKDADIDNVFAVNLVSEGNLTVEEIKNFMRLCCEVRLEKVKYKDDELLARILDKNLI